jgi:hypothetical protein
MGLREYAQVGMFKHGTHCSSSGPAGHSFVLTRRLSRPLRRLPRRGTTPARPDLNRRTALARPQKSNRSISSVGPALRGEWAGLPYTSRDRSGCREWRRRTRAPAQAQAPRSRRLRKPEAHQRSLRARDGLGSAPRSRPRRMSLSHTAQRLPEVLLFCLLAPSVRPKLASPALGSSAHPRRCWLARARACELACERACNIKGWTFDLNRHSQCRRSIRWRTLHHSSHAAAGPNMHVGCMAVDSQAAAALTTQTPQPHLGA